MPAATAERMLRPFDRKFEVITVDGETYKIGRYSQREAREYFAPLRQRLRASGAAEEVIVESENARFLQLVVWDSVKPQRLLARLNESGRDTQFDTDEVLNAILGADEGHIRNLFEEVLRHFPEYAASEKKAEAASPETPPPSGA